MLRILGPAGFDSYKVLCEQTTANRERIVVEARGRYEAFLAEALANILSLDGRDEPEFYARLARIHAERAIQEETGRRISEEDRAFRERCQNLFAWTHGKQ